MRAGHSTEAIAASISTMAAKSCQCSCSFSHQAPASVPSTGIIITDSVEATGGSCARQVQPGGLRKAEDHHRVVDDAAPRHGHWARAQRSRSKSVASTVITSVVITVIQKTMARMWRGHAGAAQLLRAQCPGRRSQQHAAGSPGPAGHVAEFVPQQQRRRRCAAAATPLTAGGPAAGRTAPRPTAPRRSASCSPGSPRGPTTGLHRNDRHHMPDEHVGDRQRAQLTPLAAGNVQRHLQSHAPRAQHRQAQPHRQRAEAQRRVVRDAELHHRPVQTPHQGEQHQQHRAGAS